MSWKFRIVLLTSSLLFSWLHHQSLSQKDYPLPRKRRPAIPRHLLEEDFSPLNHALQLGDKRKVSKVTYQSFKKLNLLHLFTPSGLHFYPFYFILSFIFNTKIVAFSLTAILLCMTLGVPGFFALKRVIAIKALFQVPQLSLFSSFLIVFLFEYFLGSFSISPYSFAFSFLFLGLLYSGSFKSLIFSIFIAQLLISFHMETPFSFILFLFGVTISSCVSLLFPFLFFNYWTHFFSFQVKFNNFIVKYLEILVNFLGSLPVDQFSKGEVVILILIALFFKKRLLTLLFFF